MAAIQPASYEPPQIEDRTAIDNPLIGGPAGIWDPSLRGVPTTLIDTRPLTTATAIGAEIRGVDLTAQA